MPEKTIRVAWQGVSLRVPEDWSLVGVSGDDKKGYYRVDSPKSSALEVRWEKAFGKPPDLKAKAKDFLAGFEKTCRKRKIQFSNKIKDDAEGVAFTWKADRLGQGRLRYCRECDRVIIAQVISTRDEDITGIVPLILDSLRDHREDGLLDWGLYGLEFAMPPGYRIVRQKLLSGYLSLEFKDKAKSLTVERWGLAKTLVGSLELDEWYRKDVMPDIKGYRAEITSEQIKGHAGLVIKGKRAGLKQAAKALLAATTLYPHPGLLTGYAWHCEESNKLFGVRGTHVDGDDTVDKVFEIISCH